jgi:hypothetical protein
MSGYRLYTTIIVAYLTLCLSFFEEHGFWDFLAIYRFPMDIITIAYLALWQSIRISIVRSPAKGNIYEET